MTPIAALVAEAIAKAEETTPEHFAPKNECPDDAHAARYVTTIEGGSQLDGKESTLAEAVAWAEDPGGENSDSDGRWCQYPDHVVYVRRDLFTNALAHLATRAAEAEGRAERAEARATKLRTALDQLSAWFERARTLSLGGKATRSVAMVARNTDDAEKEAPRG